MLAQLPTSIDVSMFSNNNSNNIILLDFDDSIMPTTWLLQWNKLNAMSQEQSVQVCSELSVMEDNVERFLRHLLPIARVILVTNAELGWVEKSCKRFMPKVLALLPFIKITSARERFQHTFPNQPDQWKLHAFREVLQSNDNTRRLNLISVGDSMFERYAVHAVGKEHGNALSKSVQLIPCPLPKEICHQLGVLLHCIHDIVQCDMNLDLLMKRQGIEVV